MILSIWKLVDGLSRFFLLTMQIISSLIEDKYNTAFHYNTSKPYEL